MNIIYKPSDTNNVIRLGTSAVRCNSGVVCYNGTNYPIEQLEQTSLTTGEYSAWIKQTWQIQRNIKYLALNGIPAGSYQAVCALAYQDEYTNPSFEYVVGKSYLQATGDQPVLQTTDAEFYEIFYSRIADITVEPTNLIIENKVPGMTYIPPMREYYGKGALD